MMIIVLGTKFGGKFIEYEGFITWKWGVAITNTYNCGCESRLSSG